MNNANITQIKEAFEKNLQDYLDETPDFPIAEKHPVIFREIRDFIFRKASRIRPLLLLLSYGGYQRQGAKYSGGEDSSTSVAIALELLHTFALVHDDLIDRDTQRRSRATMQEALGNTMFTQLLAPQSPADLSLLVGDVLYTAALKVVTRNVHDQQLQKKVLDELLDAAVTTGNGALKEILDTTKDLAQLTENDIWHNYEQKTAQYSFNCPLKLGYALAVSDGVEMEQDKLVRLGNLIGRAYQIKNDLNDLVKSANAIEKTTEYLGDIFQGKHTYPVYLLYQHADSGIREELEELYRQPIRTPDEVWKIYQWMISIGIPQKAEHKASSLLWHALGVLDQTSMHQKYKKTIAGILQQEINRCSIDQASFHTERANTASTYPFNSAYTVN